MMDELKSYALAVFGAFLLLCPVLLLVHPLFFAEPCSMQKKKEAKVASMTVAPITPDQVIEKRRAGIPPQVFEAFNELLERKYQGGSCTIEQDEAVDLILKKRIDMNRAQIFESGWLDIEPSYRDAGWDVTYDKPGYSESYAARFVFSRKPAK